MTSSNATVDDTMAQIMIKRQMKALFGNGAVNATEEASSMAEFEAKSIDESIDESSLVGKKRKHSSSLDDDDESASLPSLELEDDDDVALSELEIDNDGDSVCCDSKEANGCKRQRKLQEFSSDLIVVLDMDECLIHFKMQDEEKENEGVQQQQTKGEQQQQQEQQKVDAAHKTNKNDPSILYVNEHQVLLRPGLVEFLTFVTNRFQTHIFTAGTQDYADAILDQLSRLVAPHRDDIFCKRWYRDDCDTIDILDPLTAYCIDSIYVKPLSKVAQWAGRDPHDLARIVHIDDQAKNFLLNHGNGILVNEWRGNDNNHNHNPNHNNSKDDHVLQTVTKVLKKIDDTRADVRPHLVGESYLALKDHLDLMHLFPHRRTKGIGSTLLS